MEWIKALIVVDDTDYSIILKVLHIKVLSLNTKPCHALKLLY